MKAFLKRLPWLVGLLVVVGLVAYAFVPQPVEVDVGSASRGAMRETVDQDGETRVKQRYVVSAPLAGETRRITLDEGDEVVAGQTVVAAIRPAAPGFLDLRAAAQAEAAVRRAEASLNRASPDIERARAELDIARVERRRLEQLSETQVASRDELEQAVLRVSAREAELKAAEYARDVAAHELEQARAALVMMTDRSATRPHTLPLTSPVTGRVLRVLQESETSVAPGTPLIEVGDVREIECVIDVLSRDAVQVRPGQAALLERWGGGAPLNGVVRVVEPGGFMKVSALGVEEQRVNVIIDFTDPLDRREALGHAYRVDARIIVWQSADVLKVPTGALFRQGERWAVFVVRGGRAVASPITVGHLNGLEAEVLDGVSDGDEVILHPSDKVKDGVRVVRRTT